MRADSELLALARPEIARVAGRRGERFDRAEFGLWTKLGPALAQAIGRISEKREPRARIQEAAGPAAALMERLAGERIWQVLDQARGKRNTRVHGGVLPLAEVESRIATLEVLLSDAEQALASGFEDIDLARADQGRRTRGLHIYPCSAKCGGCLTVFVAIAAFVPRRANNVPTTD